MGEHEKLAEKLRECAVFGSAEGGEGLMSDAANAIDDLLLEIERREAETDKVKGQLKAVLLDYVGEVAGKVSAESALIDLRRFLSDLKVKDWPRDAVMQTRRNVLEDRISIWLTNNAPNEKETDDD